MTRDVGGGLDGMVRAGYRHEGALWAMLSGIGLTLILIASLGGIMALIEFFSDLLATRWSGSLMGITAKIQATERSSKSSSSKHEI
jgi:hypothetical protein